MEYQVGSLADLISGSSSSKKAEKSKKIIENAGTKVKYEKVTILRTKTKGEKKRKKTDVDSSKTTKRLRFSEPLEITPSVVEGEDVKWVTGAKKKIGKKKSVNNQQSLLDPEEESRTIFVGNLPKTTKPNFLKGIFIKYGNIETVRFRSASVADPQTSKKVAVIKGQLHPGRTNINGYVRFETVKSARKALAANGMVVNDHTLRVDLAVRNTDYEQKKCVFIGNLKFTVEEEDLRKMFDGCGKILNVRVVRDNITGMGKGIAFINFESSESVELALRLHEEDLMGRPLRVSRLKGKGNGFKKERKRAFNPNASKGEIVNSNTENAKRRKEKKKKTGAEQNKPVSSEFQGERTEKNKLKKKKKKNKGELKKKIMQARLGITPKSPKMEPTKKS